jgi:hypothetical protein
LLGKGSSKKYSFRRANALCRKYWEDGNEVKYSLHENKAFNFFSDYSPFFLLFQNPSERTPLLVEEGQLVISSKSLKRICCRMSVYFHKGLRYAEINKGLFTMQSKITKP